MRLLILGSILLCTITAAGCFRFFDVHGCGGEADWTEPGLTHWVQAHGFRHGFGPPLNARGRIEELLPASTMLVAAVRTASIDSTTVHVALAGTTGDLGVSREPGAPRPSEAALSGFLAQTLEAVYMGDASNRPDAAKLVRENYWLTKDAESAFFFRTQNAWNFDKVLVGNGSFVPIDGGRQYELRVGEWLFAAAEPEWRRVSETVRDPHVSLMTVDRANHTSITYFYLDEAQEVKDLVRRTIPDFAWTFEGFRFDTSCPSPY